MIWYERLCTGLIGIILVIVLAVIMSELGDVQDDYYNYVIMVIIFGIFAAVVGAWGLMMVWAPDKLGSHLHIPDEASEEMDESDTNNK